MAAALGFSTATPAVGMADAVPGTLTHQGRLFDEQGNPVSGKLPMAFNFYEGAGDPAPKVSETLQVQVDDGYFSVTLGETVSISSILDGKPKYVGIAGGDDAE